MMIGIFDSGVGGLTVARAIKQQLPGYDMMYFGDTAHTPYGTKSAETVARATSTSGIYEIKIMESQPRAKIHSVACPLLVPLVEEGWLDKAETAMIIKKYLRPLKTRQIDTLILGCTHYPLLKKVIQRKIGKRVRLIDSSISVAGGVKAFLAANAETDRRLSRNGHLALFVSDVTDQFKKIAEMTLKTKITFECVRT
ncbi:MAG: glutamate racemase [Desulfobacterales bacterium]